MFRTRLVSLAIFSGVWGTLRFATPEANAQECSPTWEHRTDGGPPARVHHVMCYFAAGKSTLVVTGYIPDRNDTWGWNGLSWTEACGECAYPARRGAVLEYDSRRGVAVLGFGGASDGFSKNDLWEYDGSEWLERTPDDGAPWPRPRNEAASCFDPVSGELVIFAGAHWEDNELLQDMWAWNGVHWREIEPQPGDEWPAPRQGARMVFDTVRNVIVLFGGMTSVYPDENDFIRETWEYSQGRWELKSDDSGPSERSSFAFAFMPTRRTAVLHGGWDRVDGQSIGLDDCWEWNGVAWHPLQIPTPGPRYAHRMVYDSDRKVLVLYGGEHEIQMLGDTWEMHGGCTGTEYLNAICRTRNDGSFLIKGTLGRGMPGCQVTFYLDGQCPKDRTINDRGKCRARWPHCQGPIEAGPHTVSAALSCGTVVERATVCP